MYLVIKWILVINLRNWEIYSYIFLNMFCIYHFIRSYVQYLKTNYCTFLKENPFEIRPSPDPKFVGSAVIPDNDDRDDDKVYFFFTELETDSEGVKKAVNTHVGRVCAVRMPKW